MEENIIRKEEEAKLDITKASEKYLKEISNWTMFFSVLGFIFVGLIVIGTIFYAIFVTVFSNDNMPLQFPLTIFIFILYLGLAVLYFFPVHYLYKFTLNTKNAILRNEKGNIETAFQNLKSHFKFMGIVSIIIISLYLLIAIIVVLIGGLSHFPSTY